jgi:predicted secreted Zn-dependent protease
LQFRGYHEELADDRAANIPLSLALFAPHGDGKKALANIDSITHQALNLHGRRRTQFSTMRAHGSHEALRKDTQRCRGDEKRFDARFNHPIKDTGCRIGMHRGED